MRSHVQVLTYFAMMLPGSAMLVVYLRPLLGLNTADGFEVSSTSKMSWFASRFCFWSDISVLYVKYCMQVAYLDLVSRHDDFPMR